MRNFLKIDWYEILQKQASCNSFLFIGATFSMSLWKTTLIMSIVGNTLAWKHEQLFGMGHFTYSRQTASKLQETLFPALYHFLEEFIFVWKIQMAHVAFLLELLSLDHHPLYLHSNSFSCSLRDGARMRQLSLYENIESFPMGQNRILYWNEKSRPFLDNRCI